MAGSWGSHDVKHGSFADQKVLILEAEGTGDSSDGSFPTWTVTDTEGVISGLLLGARVIFDGVVTPTAIDIQVTDRNGVDLLGGAATGANKFTDTGKVSLSPPEMFHTTLSVVIATEAANANASDKAKVVLYVLP